MLYMVPLESYPDRYTAQLDGTCGWWAKALKRADIKYERIEGDVSNVTVKGGVVLDPTRRTEHCFTQILKILDLAKAGKLDEDDIIYFSDFWHPGIEALPYTFHQMGIKPHMYAFWHAQSVDEYDFTYPMRWWMRNYEHGEASFLDGIFVSCPSMKKWIIDNQICDESKVHAHGHVWDTNSVMEMMPVHYQDAFMKGETVKKSNHVVFSSRWDKEKQPDFFMDVIREIIVTHDRDDIRFVICSGRDPLPSNDPSLISRLNSLRSQFPENVFVETGCTKQEYYAHLAYSKVQFNCSLQDWVSYVLLEGSVAGCIPIYPRFRSFPETLFNSDQFLYKPWDKKEAAEKIVDVMDLTDETWMTHQILTRSWIHKRFDSTTYRILREMGLGIDNLRKTQLYKDANKDPFRVGQW